MDSKQAQTAAGLCANCVNARRVKSERGSTFWLCQLSVTDTRFAKYPRLPVLSCEGYAAEHSPDEGVVVVVESDPAWPGQFQSLKSRIANGLGELARQIEHVGSTAVPGLAAKPIIDLDVLLRSASDFAAATQKLGELGYLHRGDLGIPGREAFAAPPGKPEHHLYVCLAENGEFRRHVVLRDYLRAHGAEANAYGALKRELAARFSRDRAAYVEGKQSFVKELMDRALAWAGLLNTDT
jgi:GrpB-like predicted nucleotidyltransferase (UPF0157 family)